MKRASSRKGSGASPVGGRSAWLAASAVATLLAVLLVGRFVWPDLARSFATSAVDEDALAVPPSRGVELQGAAGSAADSPPARLRSDAATGTPETRTPPPDSGDETPRPVTDESILEEQSAPYFPQPFAYAGASGLEVFPPMGSKSILRGIIVPDDFELPEGFVRHHQVSDEGEPLPAILRFHPDYQPLDENGEAIAVPESRVVPPEYAPEGLPIEILELPEVEK